MTAFTFFGCALTAYGTPLSLFLITICSDPVKIIILILSAFFWLLSLLLSAILWTAVVPLKVVKGSSKDTHNNVVGGIGVWIGLLSSFSRDVSIPHLSSTG